MQRLPSQQPASIEGIGDKSLYPAPQTTFAVRSNAAPSDNATYSPIALQKHRRRGNISIKKTKPHWQ
ncbi:hypothetical protein N9B31_00310 [Mariniblastus sp.]|nr:hypothetical protein [Mariniblastus sp.]MDA7902075.1 hypothetical protein [Mariniblastus sp.]MDA7904408.1 hypothetical protein [bacterium]MDA7905460.1 hypothetical protein [Mariniblastus sp.]MDC0293909.1 hypothetical protein [Mariniblastus sp.]